MSCLTDLEKALGIDPVDLNFESVEFNVNSEKKPKRNEVDYSTSAFQETKRDSNYTPEFSNSKLNFGDYSPLCSKLVSGLGCESSLRKCWGRESRVLFCFLPPP